MKSTSHILTVIITKLFSIGLLCFFSLELFAQTAPTVTLKTSNTDTSISFLLSAESTNTLIKIDWGKGVTSSYTIDTSMTKVENSQLSEGLATIKIYGSTIKGLDCSNNSIYDLDVKNCTKLEKLICRKNQLMNLDITANNKLTYLDCSYNHLNFSTLPAPTATMLFYNYAPQLPVPVSRKVKAGDIIDLSKYLSVIDDSGVSHTTQFIWKNGIGETLAQGSDYTISAPGIFTFHKKPSHIVFCEMINNLFPSFKEEKVVRTSSLTPDGFTLPLAFNFQTTGVSNIQMGLSSVTDSVQIKIDWGNGSVVTTDLSFLGKNMENIKSLSNTSAIKVYGEGISTLHGSNCKISDIDLSKLVLLDSLNLDSNLVSFVDVSKNIRLRYFSIYNNTLDYIDVSNNPLLKTLDCSRCWLYDLDVSRNLLLERLYCNDNSLIFQTLPIPRKSFKEYVYSPQNFTFQRSFPSDNVCDLTDYYSATDINGNIRTTNYKWNLGGRPCVEGVDYKNSGSGYFLLYKTPQSLIYCEMTNAAFPDLSGIDALKFGYKIKPAAIIKAGTTDGFYLNFASVVDTNLITIEYGSGSYYSNTCYGQYVPSRNAAYDIAIYAEDLTFFQVSEEANIKSLNLDFSNSNKLREVYCVGNDNLETLIFAESDAIEKITCQNNNLKTLNVNALPSLKYLASSNNQLSTIDVTKNTELTMLYVGNNKLSTIDISKNIKLDTISFRDNYLTTLDISKNPKLSKVYCYGNKLSFSSLPQPSASFAEYKYAPQSDYSFPLNVELNVQYDLSSQASAKGQENKTYTTNYLWKTTSGKTLIPGSDYTIDAPGKFRFVSNVSDSIYCEMSNQAFPDFGGTNVFKTNLSKINYSEDVINLYLSTTEIQLNNGAGNSGSVNITSNTTWTVVSDQAWLTVNPSFGSNNGTITLTASVNNTTSVRTATVTVSGNGADSKTISVTQEAGLMLTVSQNIIALDKDGNNAASINITSNTSWSAVSDQNWLTVSPSSGTENGIVIFTARANPSNSARSAMVTISAAGVTPQVITVMQAAGTNGVSSLTEELVPFYPNPVADGIFLCGIDGKSIITLSDMSGNICFRKEVSVNEYIPLNSLPQGVYILKLSSDKGIVESKLVKE